MLEYRDRTVQEVAACTCDRCGRRMTPDDDQWKWYEKVSLDRSGGFGSVFGDGARVSLVLCQQCVRETLVASCRSAVRTGWLNSNSEGRRAPT
jgi:hypothetical protein